MLNKGLHVEHQGPTLGRQVREHGIELVETHGPGLKALLRHGLGTKVVEADTDGVGNRLGQIWAVLG